MLPDKDLAELAAEKVELVEEEIVDPDEKIVLWDEDDYEYYQEG